VAGNQTNVHTDVLIVGAGPVGMMTAMLLAQQSIASVLADPRNEYVPSAVPGARAPHLWLDPRYGLSTIDLFGGAVLVRPDGMVAWRQADHLGDAEETLELVLQSLTGQSLAKRKTNPSHAERSGA
jgi:glycine/D-amino acid oxidase-like deaminating enzyme